MILGRLQSILRGDLPDFPEEPPGDGGRRIVLTASRAEMADFGMDPYIAFYNTFPHKLVRRAVEKYFQSRPNPDGTERFALYGLRKVEALLKEKYGDDVVVAHPDNLHRFIGPRTELVGISTMDPVGLAYVSTTYNSILGFGGISMNAVEFKALLNHPSIKRYRENFKILVGGAGVWQIRDSGWQKELGIDYLFRGEAEESLLEVVEKILKGEKLPPYIVGKPPDYNKTNIPVIKGGASYGMVEITRGCGRGCQFCTPTMRRRISLPLEHIMKEVEVNVRAGSEMIFIATEDAFLWNTHPNFVPNREALVKLYSTIASHPSVRYIQISHAAIAPVLADRKLLDELTPILLPKTRYTPDYKRTYKRPFVTVEVGIESGSPRIMKRYMRGKALPFSVEKWPEIVVEGIGEFNDHDWWPLCTLMTGLPGEREEDLIQTLNLIDDLKGSKVYLVPLFFIPLEEAILGKERRANLKNISELQWEFISRCWSQNIDFWAPQVRYYIGPAALTVYLSYLMWVHGPQALRPLLKFTGLPERVVGGYVGKGCDPSYCFAK